MFPMTVSIHNQAQLNAVLNVLAVLARAQDVPEQIGRPWPKDGQACDGAKAPEVAPDAGKSTSAEPAADKPARGRRTAAAAEAAAPAPSTEQQAPPPSTAPTADASSASDKAAPVTYDQVAAAVFAIVKAKGRDAAVAALKSLGVSKAPELKADQYPSALVQLEAVLEA